MRTPVGALVLLAALTGPAVPNRAHAEETAPPPAAALPPLSRSDLELLPLGEAPRARFHRDHADLLQRFEAIAGRAERVEKNLRERERPDAPQEPGTVALREERARLAASLDGLVPEIEARLAQADVPAGALERARRAPRGPVRADRYGRALVLERGDLTPEQAALYRRLVPAVDGAVLALHAEAEALRKATGPDTDARREVANQLDQRRLSIERRFWRTVNALLSVEQRAAIGRWLPSAHQKKEDGLSHVYLLPGLTPSQGVRFKALLLELEAEASADTSEVKRAQAALADGSVTGEARKEHERALQAAQGRLVGLQLRAYDQAKAMFTPEQWREVVALPPHVTGADRQEPLEKMLEGFPLEPAQRQALHALGLRYLGVKRELEAAYRDVARRMGESTPDAPEREMAEMMGAGVGGRAVAVLREAYGELFAKILTPDQIEAWVLGLVGKGR